MYYMYRNTGVLHVWQIHNSNTHIHVKDMHLYYNAQTQGEIGSVITLQPRQYKNTIVVYLTKKGIHLCQHQYSVKLAF